MEKDIINKINSLKIQGAKEVALASLNILENVLRKYGKDVKFYEMCDFLENLRPTAVVDYNVIEFVKNNANLEDIEMVRKYLRTSQNKINENMLEVIGKYKRIMTHCHSSEELKALVYAKKKGYDFEVYVTETRPKLQGLKSAKELLDNGIKVRYIVDSAAGYYMEKVDVCLFGSDAIRKEGIYNKIGTYMMSVVAKRHGKDVVFVGDMLKKDEREKVVMEMRPNDELLSKSQARILLNDEKFVENIDIENPAFDLTPWELVDYVVTDKGIFKDWESMKDIKWYE